MLLRHPGPGEERPEGVTPLAGKLSATLSTVRQGRRGRGTPKLWGVETETRPLSYQGRAGFDARVDATPTAPHHPISVAGGIPAKMLGASQLLTSRTSADSPTIFKRPSLIAAR
jgi:hypothetical protein